MINTSIDCPVDRVSINENKARIAAFLVVLVTAACLLSGSWIIAALLLVDFVLRGLNLNAYSPLSLISGEAVKLFRVKNKPVDRAPKRFAAFTGAVFSALILASLLLHLGGLATIIAAILIVFASLESFAGFCAGCYVYSMLKPLR
jgi:hypothetical protein